MRKLSRKIITIALALMMAIVCAIPAFAENGDPQKEVKLSSNVTFYPTEEAEQLRKDNPVAYAVMMPISIAGGAVGEVIGVSKIVNSVVANEMLKPFGLDYKSTTTKPEEAK